jgi:predicted amidophosphoribosyltransferase
VLDIFSASLPKLAHHVLIVDDVVTTGSTAEALKHTLEAAGYRVLGVVAVSVAQPKQP